jgi:hypothetical protein
LSKFLADGKELAKLLNIEDRRFSSSWKPSTIRLPLKTAESVVAFLKERYLEDREGFLLYGTTGGGLLLAKDLKQAKISVSLSVRWLARQSKLQGTLRFFQLFVKEKYEDIEKAILSTIEQDRKQLKNIEKEDEFVRDTPMEKKAHVEQAALSRLEDLLFSTGQLLYSFSEHIRMSARDKLIEWFAPLLPNYYPTPEHESEAWAMLLAAATANDVYVYLKKGRNEYYPLFSNYLQRYLSFLNAKVFWQNIPIPFRKRLSKILRFERRFFVENGWEPNIEEISIGTGLSENAVLRTKELYYWINAAVIFEDTSKLEPRRLYASVG